MHLTEPWDLWWPVGYGSQTLHTFTIRVIPTKLPAQPHAESATKRGDMDRLVQLNNCSRAYANAERVSQQLESGCACDSSGNIPGNDGKDGKTRGNILGNDGEDGGNWDEYSRWGSQHATVVTRRIGLRKVELRREKLQDGEGFFFMVNDIPIYAKGEGLLSLCVKNPCCQSRLWQRYWLCRNNFNVRSFNKNSNVYVVFPYLTLPYLALNYITLHYITLSHITHYIT